MRMPSGLTLTCSLACTQALLCACASTFAPPTAGPLARLDYPAKSVSQGLVASSFELQLGAQEPDGCAHLQPLAEQAESPLNSVNLSAGQDYLIVMTGTAATRACAVALWFRPQQDGHYHATFSFAGQTCTGQIYTIAADQRVTAPIRPAQLHGRSACAG